MKKKKNVKAVKTVFLIYLCNKDYKEISSDNCKD